MELTGLKVHLFGAFQVWRGKELIERHEWDRQKTRSLLKLLLIGSGRAFSHSEIIEALWSGVGFDAAERSLRVTVSLLRKVLEPELARGIDSRYIVQRRPGYAFEPGDDCWVDAWEFERLRAAAHSAREQGELKETARDYKAALALVQGEFLAEDPYATWAMEAKETWRERQFAVLAALAECQALRGLYGEAIHACQQALTLDAYREDIVRQLMLYRYCAGEQALALQVYRRYRKFVQEEFGTAPSAELQQLRAQIEAREVAGVDTRRRYPVVERLLRLPYSLGQMHFAGREKELSFLAVRLEAAIKSVGGAVTVEGEAGVGKTRLVEEFLDYARSCGACVFVGRCYERELDPPLEPVLTALAPLLVTATLLPDALQRDDQQPAYLSGEDPYDSSRVYQALTGALLKEARQNKVLVLFVDDLQWTDPATLQFLAYLAKRVSSEPVLLVTTYRREDVADLAVWLDHLAERRAVTGLSLGRLTLDETADLLETMMSTDFAEPARLADFLHQESEGNPFYVVEYLRWLIEAGIAETNAEGCVSALKTELLQQVTPPSSVHSLIQARLHSLSEEARVLLDLAAVIGRNFELDLVCRAAGRDEAEVVGVLEPLIAKGLIAETSGEEYHFSHDKLRQALYDAIDSPKRRALHLLVAHGLEAAGGEPSELAHHYLRGVHPCMGG